MKNLRYLFVAGLLVQACSSATSSATAAPATESSASSNTSSASEASATPEPTAEPALIPPPAINADFLTQVTAQHEYWPVIRQAVGLWDEAHFGMSQTAWALSPDGRYVAVAGCDGEAGSGDPGSYLRTVCQVSKFQTVMHAYAFILDANTESIIATLPETGEAVTIDQLAFTRDSNKLVYRVDTSKYDLDTFESEPSGKVEIWDIPSGRVQTELPDAGIFMISPDDKWMILGLDAGIKKWDFATEQVIGELPGDVFPQSISPDGKRALAEEYPYLTVYDTGDWQKVSQQLLMPDGYLNAWAISPDLSMLAICDKGLPGAPVRIWNVATGELTRTGKGDWGRCGSVRFSPDSRLLLLFDDHGAGPVIWKVDGWKLVQANPNVVTFVGDEDLFVDELQFSQDGRHILAGTFKRLTLYAVPAGAEAATVTPAATATAGPAVTLPPVDIPAMSCDMVITVAVEAHVQGCLTYHDGLAGELSFRPVITMNLRAEDLTSVEFSIPVYLLRLQPGTYEIGDATNGLEGGLTARFTYYDPSLNFIGAFDSYAPGTIIFTQTGQYLSGSFSFGARSSEGRQVIVEGNFENIPFTQVNLP